ncbi:exported protein of unknown function [Nitrospira defluvii]|jgi:hypothetical protein|uniref:Uncharacterized protein n=1 Tax=Nitrospira defluvii TaxID=330214 RepID=D8PD15_9BACT|nr:exported protein of unknown function [Nitrospira defluvii]
MLSGPKRLLITLLLFRASFAALLPDINSQSWLALPSMNKVLIEWGLIFMGIVFGYMLTSASASTET